MYRDLSDLFIGSILQSYNFVTINLNYYNYFGILCKEMVSCKKTKLTKHLIAATCVGPLPVTASGS